jgi:hypothetical protein
LYTPRLPAEGNWRNKALDVTWRRMNGIAATVGWLLSASVMAGPSSQPNGAWFTTDDAQIILKDFPTAPFPHPSRADGWTNKTGTKFSAEKYRDSTVGIVIPRSFKPSKQLDLIVHFHGHSNYLASVLDNYHLAAEVVASGRNAILIVPQGPREAADSNFGKMEDAGGFEAMVRDVVKYLHDEKKIPTTDIGKITITAHSGGYNAASAVIAVGGLSDHITDVLLFDASYGNLERFADWIAAGKNRRLISIFTAHLASANVELTAMLHKRNVNYDSLIDENLTPVLLAPRRAIFIHTLDLAHDDVISKRHYYAIFLSTVGF